MCGLVGKNVSKGRFMFFSVVCRLIFFKNISAHVEGPFALFTCFDSNSGRITGAAHKKRCTLVNEKKLGKLKLGVLEVMCENLSIPVTPDQRRK